MPSLTTKNLRRSLIQKRAQLSPQQIVISSQLIFKKLFTMPVFLRSRRIALYLPANGEVDTQFIFTRVRDMQKTCFLPVLHPFKHNSLLFMKYQSQDKLITNRYGIAEPAITTEKIAPPWSLDLVITPLVAFDSELYRLGMGGGFYDRTFAYLSTHKYLQRPTLLGVAYEFQKVSQLDKHAWDIPLNIVVTESTIYTRE